MVMENYWLKTINILLLKLKITGLFLSPVVLFFVPLGFFKKQASICIFKNLTGLSCYGCGMTRAVFYALHLRFQEAWHFNPLFVVVLPLIILLWAHTLQKLFASAIFLNKN